MDVAAQLIPTDQNRARGGVPGKQYGVVGKLGWDNLSASGTGYDLILGMSFLQRYYMVGSSGSSWEKHNSLNTFAR